MSKTFNFILIIILTTYIYTSGTSECESNGITHSERRRIETLTEEICKQFKTSDDSIYECKLNAVGDSCEESEKTSECVQKKETVGSRRRLATELTEEDCKSKKTSDDTIYKCVLNTQKNRCIETIISRCKSTIGRRLSTDLSEEICKELETSDNTIYKCFYDEKSKRCDETYLYSECKSKRPSTSSRRLSSELTENECSKAKTSDDTKYKCVLSNNKNECEEVSKENSNVLKLSFTILCLLLFI